MMDLDEVYNSTIKKTQSLLESKGIALSLREIKKLDTINLSGFRNDGERLLRLELAEKYGENKLEQSLGYQILYPFIDEGIYSDSAFIIFDIDKFKLVNDTYGHYFGDCVLQCVAARLKESVREDSDIAIRYGGDEFVVYVNYKQEDNIKDIVNRIFNNVSCIYEGYQISISMGISLLSDGNPHYYDMYRNADKALYEAKRSGRGQYRFYGECRLVYLIVI